MDTENLHNEPGSDPHPDAFADGPEPRVIAVLHVHGMGEQKRYSSLAETSSAIVQALTEDVYAHPCSLQGVVADGKDQGHDDHVIAGQETCNCTLAQLASVKRTTPEPAPLMKQEREPQPWEPTGGIGQWTYVEAAPNQVQLYRVEDEIHKKHVVSFKPPAGSSAQPLEVHVLETYWAPLATGVNFWYTFAWMHKVWLALFRNIWPLSRPLKFDIANGVRSTRKFSWNIESCKRVLKLLSTMYILIIAATAFILYGVISSSNFFNQLKSLDTASLLDFLIKQNNNVSLLFFNSERFGMIGMSIVVILIALIALITTSNIINSPMPYQAFKMMYNGKRLLFPLSGVYGFVIVDVLWHCSIWHTWWTQFSTSSWWIALFNTIPQVGGNLTAITSTVWRWLCWPFDAAARGLCLQQFSANGPTIPYARFDLPITTGEPVASHFNFCSTLSGESFAVSLILVTFFIHFSFWLKLFKMHSTKQYPVHFCMLLLFFNIASIGGVWAFSVGMMLPAPFFLFYFGFYILSWRWLNFWLAHWFGDVALFTNQNENSPLYQRRREIIRCMVKQLDYVFGTHLVTKDTSGKTCQARPDYKEVIIYGHSLGCLVSYYGLCDYFRRIFVSGDSALFHKITTKFKAYVTTGCHLDIVEYLFDPGSTENRYYDTLRAFGRYVKPPTLTGATPPTDWQPLHNVCWVNIWHWWDVFSSKLFQYGDVINARVWGSIPLLCHSYYMQISRVRGLMKHILLMPQRAASKPQTALGPPLVPLKVQPPDLTSEVPAPNSKLLFQSPQPLPREEPRRRPRAKRG